MANALALQVRVEETLRVLKIRKGSKDDKKRVACYIGFLMNVKAIVFASVEEEEEWKEEASQRCFEEKSVWYDRTANYLKAVVNSRR
jgi:hypothetical protein